MCDKPFLMLSDMLLWMISNFSSRSPFCLSRNCWSLTRNCCSLTRNCCSSTRKYAARGDLKSWANGSSSCLTVLMSASTATIDLSTNVKASCTSTNCCAFVAASASGVFKSGAVSGVGSDAGSPATEAAPVDPRTACWCSKTLFARLADGKGTTGSRWSEISSSSMSREWPDPVPDTSANQRLAHRPREIEKRQASAAQIIESNQNVPAVCIVKLSPSIAAMFEILVRFTRTDVSCCDESAVWATNTAAECLWTGEAPVVSPWTTQTLKQNDR